MIIDETRETRVEDVPGIHQPEATDLASSQYDALMATLRTLDEAQWDAPTDCELWTVKDIAAHLCAWAELMTSFTEARRIVRAAFARRKELGNILDAANQTQVDARAALTTEDLLARMDDSLPKMLKVRARLGRYGRYVPLAGPPAGFYNLGFLANVIFTRDAFMHRIDIARATSAPLDLGAPEARIVADIVRDWLKRGSGDVRVVLTGAAGGVYVTGPGPHAELTADAVELCRFFAGRADRSVVAAVGDPSTVEARLAVPVTF